MAGDSLPAVSQGHFCWRAQPYGDQYRSAGGGSADL